MSATLTATQHEGKSLCAAAGQPQSGLGPRVRCRFAALREVLVREGLMKKAFVAGITRQNGSYLAELLL